MFARANVITGKTRGFHTTRGIGSGTQDGGAAGVIAAYPNFSPAGRPPWYGRCRLSGIVRTRQVSRLSRQYWLIRDARDALGARLHSRAMSSSDASIAGWDYPAGCRGPISRPADPRSIGLGNVKPGGPIGRVVCRNRLVRQAGQPSSALRARSFSGSRRGALPASQARLPARLARAVAEVSQVGRPRRINRL